MGRRFRALVHWLIVQAKERTIAREQKGRYYFVPGDHEEIKKHDPKLWQLLTKKADATTELDDYLLSLQ